jgi:APA family basic amino acid/polyamine antiporter
MLNNLFRRKPIEKILAESESGPNDGHPSNGMHQILSVRDLTFMGVAAVIGGGIFSTIGAAAYNGGPGVVLLFLITAVTCGFTALCYAEFASRVPASGSAYTYSYVTFGEVVAWIIGWALILEYAIGNIVVAISWSAYFNNILKAFGIDLPNWLTTGYQTARMAYNEAVAAGSPTEGMAYSQAPRLLGVPFVVNLPAAIIVLLVTILAYVGMQESKRTANLMVFIKIAVLVFIAAIGLWYIFAEGTTSNWTPFLPNGMEGVLKGVSAVFFAYIGFDAISTTAEECRDPRRDLPRGMIYALLICTLIYAVTALVITGMVRYSEFKGVTDPLAYVFEKIDMKEVGFIISVSAVVAATSVLLVFQLGQPRIWMSMSRDGLLPASFSRIHPRFRTPSFSTVVSGLLVGVLVLFVDDRLMTDLTSIGTLFAFVLVCGGVLLLPRMQRSSDRFSLPYIDGKWIVPLLWLGMVLAFRERIAESWSHATDGSSQETMFLVFILLSTVMAALTFLRNHSLIPVLGVLSCCYLMVEIPAKSWMVFFGWMALGLTVYFGYGRQHSRLAGR